MVVGGRHVVGAAARRQLLQDLLGEEELEDNVAASFEARGNPSLGHCSGAWVTGKYSALCFVLSKNKN